jgi:hypothetical protein
VSVLPFLQVPPTPSSVSYSTAVFSTLDFTDEGAFPMPESGLALVVLSVNISGSFFLTAWCSKKAGVILGKWWGGWKFGTLVVQ